MCPQDTDAPDSNGSEIETDLPFMAPGLVYKFRIISLQGNLCYSAETKIVSFWFPRLERYDILLKVVFNIHEPWTIFQDGFYHYCHDNDNNMIYCIPVCISCLCKGTLTACKNNLNRSVNVSTHPHTCIVCWLENPLLTRLKVIKTYPFYISILSCHRLDQQLQ